MCFGNQIWYLNSYHYLVVFSMVVMTESTVGIRSSQRKNNNQVVPVVQFLLVLLCLLLDQVVPVIQLVQLLLVVFAYEIACFGARL